MKKTLIALALLAAGNCFADYWTNYPPITVPQPGDTFLIADTNGLQGLAQFPASNLLAWAQSNITNTGTNFASATQDGLLSSNDWQTFNDKESTNDIAPLVDAEITNVALSLSDFVTPGQTNLIGVGNLTNGVPISIGTGLTLANGVLSATATGGASGGAVTSSGLSFLTTNLTLFVDALNGSNAPGQGFGPGASAFQTINYAANFAAGTYCVEAGAKITIQLADGTYTNNVILPAFLGGGDIEIAGDSATPANTVLLSRGGTCLTAQGNGNWHLQYLTLTSTNDCVAVNMDGVVWIETGVAFGHAGGAHIVVSGGFVWLNGNYTISGSANEHLYMASAGKVRAAGGITITLTGSPSFSEFIHEEACSTAFLNAVNWSGTATGPRYDVSENSVLYTGGAYGNIPGNANGSFESGGQVQ